MRSDVGARIKALSEIVMSTAKPVPHEVREATTTACASDLPDVVRKHLVSPWLRPVPAPHGPSFRGRTDGRGID